MTIAKDFTIDELICVCIARQIEDGEMVVQGIATPLVAAGYLLAKRTHAPNLVMASAIGGTICQDWAPLSLTRVEELWLGNAVATLDFDEICHALLPQVQPKEFFRPAQIDPHGNFNNVVIGDYTAPLVRLPGSGGICDVTVFSRRVYLYVPRHSPRVFVEKVDFVSGLGVPETPGRRPGPRYLVSDLGTFDFVGGRMRLISHHPGVSVADIEARTGFELAYAPQVVETPPPSAEEVRLLREEIDPLGVRTLECLSGEARRAKLREIIEGEQGG